ncbi:hypothetical protein ACWT_1361 [Actinoplanes sp. SE50]|uniref:hypothetical protein n=1 Tax=unclassified Actinoplanes TaxID=2626549 RepID=UPI00023EBE99|nr:MULTISPECIES: hypothetical protein [unclassified Actinoplanes]AEV82379.1 hypothetical protein ACPL_1482 [Actinoplanes sp. SE50/110]ATO80776.1 hypothetical protein ACWT_1361 [Actinoplanes sp. SE50]SLL98184.1 hypothetical protein ACSP50_1408 [Actinoplanes sp. SE50/110]
MTEPDGSFAPALLGTFQDAVDLLEKQVSGIRTAWDEFTRTAEEFLAAIRAKLQDDHWWNRIAEWFTDDIADTLEAIEAGIESARVKLDDILGRMDAALSGTPPILSLFRSGIDWSTTINTRLSAIQPDVEQSGSIDVWHGPAHDTYRTRETEQGEAVGLASAQVKSLSVWLADVAEANTHFVTELVDQATTIVEELVTVTLDIGTAIGAEDPLSAQEAVNNLDEMMGKYAAAIIDFLTSLANRFTEVIRLVTEVAAEHSDNSAFPGGNWPKAVDL